MAKQNVLNKLNVQKARLPDAGRETSWACIFLQVFVSKVTHFRFIFNRCNNHMPFSNHFLW